MIKENIQLSIVIATKNRQQYCIETIKTILPMADDQFQLVIADNSSNNEIEEFVHLLNDSRITYEYDPSPKSSIDNFNRCIELSYGEYVCMLGDDDAILPHIFDEVAWMKANNVDSLSASKAIDYIWPNPALKGKENGILYISSYTKEKHEINTGRHLNRLLENGIVNYASYLLPRIYHGIIKKSLMEDIREKTGNYFGALSPDIYSTISLSTIVKKHYIIDFPFTIAGACPASTSVASLNAGHSGDLKHAPHFINRKTPYQWEQKIPEFYCVETIWAESGLKALEDLKRTDLINKFNIYNLLPYIVLSNLKYLKVQPFAKTWALIRFSMKTCLSVFRYANHTYLVHLIYLFAGILKTAVLQAGKMISRKLSNNKAGERQVIDGVNNLENAIQQVSKKFNLAAAIPQKINEF